MGKIDDLEIEHELSKMFPENINRQDLADRVCLDYLKDNWKHLIALGFTIRLSPNEKGRRIQNHSQPSQFFH